MMKKILLSSLCCLSALFSFAKDGYRIEVNFKREIPDSMVYLAHYFGKNLPAAFKLDSAKVTGKQHILFERKKEVLGGIYMIIYNNHNSIAELLLDNGDNFVVTVDNDPGKSSRLDGLEFKNSPENERYYSYNKLMESLGEKNQALMGQLTGAKTHKDSMDIHKELKALARKQTDFRNDYMKQYPNTWLSTIFNAIQLPVVPEGPHYLQDGKTIDSSFAYYYFKNHYWDKFDFKDDRLIQTPIYETRLTDYFDKWVYQIPDTIKYEADKILQETKNSKELFRYTLRTLTNNALKSKVMGMDEVFVHLVENYYLKGAAYWLDSASVQWYADRAKKIAPNVIGNIAPELLMQDVFTLKDMPLHSVSAKYTLIVIWSYDCGACKKEIPLLDSVYHAVLKDKGLKIYSIASGGELTEIQKFIDKNKIQEWINVADIHNNTNFKSKYDAYSTPKIYLLDEQKTIIGKSLSHSNIADLMEWKEKKEKKQP